MTGKSSPFLNFSFTKCKSRKWSDISCCLPAFHAFTSRCDSHVGSRGSLSSSLRGSCQNSIMISSVDIAYEKYAELNHRRYSTIVDTSRAENVIINSSSPNHDDASHCNAIGTDNAHIEAYIQTQNIKLPSSTKNAPSLGSRYIFMPLTSFLLLIRNENVYHLPIKDLEKIQNANVTEYSSLQKVNLPEWFLSQETKQFSNTYTILAQVTNWDGSYSGDARLSDNSVEWWKEAELLVVDIMNEASFHERYNILQHFPSEQMASLSTIDDLKEFYHKLHSPYFSGALILNAESEQFFPYFPKRDLYQDEILINQSKQLDVGSGIVESSSITISEMNNNALHFVRKSLQERFEGRVDILCLKQKKKVLNDVLSTLTKYGVNTYWTIEDKKNISDLMNITVSQLNRIVSKLRSNERNNKLNSTARQKSRNHTMHLKNWLEENDFKAPSKEELYNLLDTLKIPKKLCLRSISYLQERHKFQNLTEKPNNSSQQHRISNHGRPTLRKRLVIQAQCKNQLRSNQNHELSTSQIEELSTLLHLSKDQVRRIAHHIFDKELNKGVSNTTEEFQKAYNIVSKWIASKMRRPSQLEFTLLLQSTKLTRIQLHHIISHLIQSQGKGEMTEEKKMQLLKWKENHARNQSRFRLKEMEPLAKEYQLSPKQLIDFFAYHCKDRIPITKEAQEAICKQLEENNWQRLNRAQLDHIEALTGLHRKQIHGIVSRKLKKMKLQAE